jgi:hypothetical protein
MVKHSSLDANARPPTEYVPPLAFTFFSGTAVAWGHPATDEIVMAGDMRRKLSPLSDLAYADMNDTTHPITGTMTSRNDILGLTDGLDVMRGAQ